MFAGYYRKISSLPSQPTFNNSVEAPFMYGCSYPIYEIQIASLASQVDSLTEINKTLRRYLEVIIPKLSPDSEDLISTESMRLENFELDREIEKTLLYGFVRGYGILIEDLKEALITSESIEGFFEKMGEKAEPAFERLLPEYLKTDWIPDINDTRKILGLKPY